MAKILIVDDREDNLFALESIFKRLGVEIVKAMTGEDALRATLNHDFALAILDVQMPGMDGYELATLMRSDEATKGIPIIFMSAVYSDEANVFRGYETGAVDFITKPFNTDVLLSKVRVFLDLDGQKTELIKQKTEVVRKSALIEGINRVLRESILCETVEDVAKTCLAVAEELTGSQFGFVGEIDEDGMFCNIAMSDPGWSACTVPERDRQLLIEKREIGGLWGKAIKEEKSLFVNDVPSHPESRGVPSGHPSIRSFLAVPLRDADKKISGMIALAGKEKGYDESDLLAIESLSVAFGEALQHKRAQEALSRSHDELEIRIRERTAKLETSNRELEDFAFVASHDLQEPLRKIRTFADMLKSSDMKSLNSTQADHLERMQGAALRMQDLIFDLLKYSRVANSHEPLTVISLESPVRDAITDLKVLFEETGGQIEVGALPDMEADPVQMRQLFQNLIENALKYHGTTPPRIRIYDSTTCQDGFYEIHVDDNGIGFDECHLEKIFKPFQRLHGRSSPFKGTGMGLAISRKIVERHGGSLTARSEQGKGTTFIVRLPERQSRTGGRIEPQ
jgi:signal transduction histidine kinase/DNA-binding response OmpR family regulator